MKTYKVRHWKINENMVWPDDKHTIQTCYVTASNVRSAMSKARQAVSALSYEVVSVTEMSGSEYDVSKVA